MVIADASHHTIQTLQTRKEVGSGRDKDAEGDSGEDAKRQDAEREYDRYGWSGESGKEEILDIPEVYYGHCPVEEEPCSDDDKGKRLVFRNGVHDLRDYRASRMWNLRRHVRTQRPEALPPGPENLKACLRRHSNRVSEKRFVCDRCDHGRDRKTALNRHLRSVGVRLQDQPRGQPREARDEAHS
ncbi:hypothetical protein AAG570_007528 [Ranatra chinensis]|uniref:C2H2-type domain-containing protein n=1 Tax=Ranatra chinensis TaxID=642074 RepID=A0ABD0YHX1_9HEMI